MIATSNGSARSRENTPCRVAPPRAPRPSHPGALPRARAHMGGAILARTAIALTLILAMLAGCQTNPSADRQKPGTPDLEDSAKAATRPPPSSSSRPEPTETEAPGTLAAGLDLWAVMRQDFRLDHEIDHPRVRDEIDALLRYPNHLLSMREGLELYLPNILAAVKSRGMPAEIALLPIIESGMNPNAEALSGPAGLWQLIPATGDRMKLPRNWWFDGRRDPELSTEAALDYLDYLHGRFDDWRLAIVSYNTGEGTVTRAIGGRTGPISFWSLRLPHHGMVFVPKLLALAEIVANPDRYGIVLPKLRTGPTFKVVDTGGQVEISKAAQALGIDDETLYLLNPGLNRSATPPDGPHRLNVPPALADQARTWIASLDRTQRVAWDRIQVARGDNLGSIANRHGTDVRTLRQINNLRDDRLRAGQYLFVPGPAARGGATAAVSTAARPGTAKPTAGAKGARGGAHVVRSGDTLWGIARAYRVPLDRLLAANGLSAGHVLKIGQRLVIPRA